MATFEVKADAETVGTAIAGGAIGFGAAGLLAPRLVIRTYGLPDTGPFRFMTRLWGTRTAALGVVMILERDARRRANLAAIAVAVNALDAVVATTAGRDLSARTKVMAAATSASFALAAGAVAAKLI